MVTLALIGAGNWGKNYINAISSIEGCELKYVCVKSKTTSNTLPDNFLKYTNYESILNKQDIDGVIIATPPKTHFKIAKAFIDNGFNVLIEKPLVTTLKEANILENTSRRSRSWVMIGHIYLYNPAYIKLKNSIKKIGKITQFIFEGYQSTPREDISVIWDWGPHPISMILDLFHREPKYIKIEEKHLNKNLLVDSLKVRMHTGGVITKVYISWFGRKRRKLTLKGTKGSLIFNDLNKPEKKLIFVNKKDKKRGFLKYKKSLPLTEEVRVFCQKITKKSKAASDLIFGQKVVKILSEIERFI